MKLFFHKILHWEYWPMEIVYFPIFFLWTYYALKTKSIFFFNASNPSIKNGGFIMESKKAIYNLIPQQYYPKTELIEEGISFDTILKTIEKKQIQYPFIAKPDIGLRGSAVKKINNQEELKSYSEKANFDYLIQDLIPYANEIGIFYVRYPDEKTGKITGIVAKEFLVVTGDGVATIETLIRKNPRHEMQLKVLQKEYGNRLQSVLLKGEQRNLVPYGNHIRGAKFIDGSHWITPELTQTINEVCLQIPDFYFGRLDVMYNTLEELERGENFSIVELNGAASEPTHIYDPKHSVFFAWRELGKHIRYMYEISVINHNKGISYLPHKVGMHEYRLHIQQNKKILNF
ncbi:ATP-grasp domain-containing protein [Flavobacterium psychrotolerans]|uniref:D-alanine--D-alanine ligase n=1 Tax=Flavobacterium psychrotolerans TaxID=2169410 RepID=A0A2U1JHG4_9FLAO|nr:D-alanine--D-alanine ligase [Flavobacterium psychrotolerans]PWA04465.1 D-alanine--D-alanine ligase [Flavobacterium psychrotolerans]